MESEIVCPFCHATAPLAGTAARPSHFTRCEPIEYYTCPCGAAGSPSADPQQGDLSQHRVENVLRQAVLQVEHGECEETRNYVTRTDPPLLMVWVRRRPPPGP